MKLSAACMNEISKSKVKVTLGQRKTHFRVKIDFNLTC